MCNMIPLQPIEDANLVSTNVPENDHAEWAVGTTYANGDRVISTTSHSVFESTADSNTGNDPDVAANVDPTTGTWVRVGSTNRWRAFDRSIGQSVSQSGSIKYTLETTTMITAVGLKGTRAAAVRLRVVNPDASEVNLLDDSEDSTGAAAIGGTLTDGVGDGSSGLGTLVEFAENSAAGFHYAALPLVTLSGSNVFSMEVKAAGRTLARVQVRNDADDLAGFIDLDLAAGTITGGTAGNAFYPLHTASSIRLVEDDRYRITMSFSGLPADDYRLVVFLNDAGGNTSYTGDGESGLFIGRIQVEAGTVETNYQEKAGGAVVGTEEQNFWRPLVDPSGINDWFDLVTFVPEFVPDHVFENLVAFVGNRVIVELDGAGSTAELSEMGWGRKVKIGDSLVGSSPGFRDKSTRTEDEFGNLTVVPRETYDTMQFRIARTVGSEEYTRRVLAQQGKGLCFYYADKDLLDRTPLVLGYRPDFDGPLEAAGRSFATLEVRGLI